MFRLFLCLLAIHLSICTYAQNKPNILLIIADDWGIEAFNGYYNGPLMPSTPTIDSLRNVGVTFDNVWSSPQCTPTRANIMSGKYGVKTGVLKAPGNLDTTHTSVFNAIKARPNNDYSGAVVGKWHISKPINPSHPDEHGADYYMGILASSPADYYAWDKTYNGQTTVDSTYVTSTFTDSAISWINNQTEPWVMWLAHVSPHSPYQLPPSNMYTLPAVGTIYRTYLAMIESLDYEVNRLLSSMPDSVRDNTTIFIVGDNGGPDNFLNQYPTGHAKGTLYQGGIHVPMVVAGKGVTRMGQREPALVHLTDIHATILEMTGSSLPGGVHNSLSFDHLLDGSVGDTRDYNYAEIVDTPAISAWTVRNQQYKLIQFEDGTQEFYDLIADTFEFSDLIPIGLTPAQQAVKADLYAEGLQIRSAWSCRDYIQNGDETGIDCGGSFCPSCVTSTDKLSQQAAAIKLFPNPSSNRFVIQNESEQNMQSVQLLDVLGRQVYQWDNITSPSFEVNISAVPKQVYWVKIILEDQSTITKKIIKK